MGDGTPSHHLLPPRVHTGRVLAGRKPVRTQKLGLDTEPRQADAGRGRLNHKVEYLAPLPVAFSDSCDYLYYFYK